MVSAWVTDARLQLTVQAFIARTAGGAGFRGVTKCSNVENQDQRRDERRHRRGLPAPLPRITS